MTLIVSLPFMLAALLLAGLIDDAEKKRRPHVVTSEYHGWTIRVTASRERADGWRAEVHVVRPNRKPTTAQTAKMALPGRWPDQIAVVLAALEMARQYIDLSLIEPA